MLTTVDPEMLCYYAIFILLIMTFIIMILFYFFKNNSHFTLYRSPYRFNNEELLLIRRDILNYFYEKNYTDDKKAGPKLFHLEYYIIKDIANFTQTSKSAILYELSKLTDQGILVRWHGCGPQYVLAEAYLMRCIESFINETNDDIKSKKNHIDTIHTLKYGLRDAKKIIAHKNNKYLSELASCAAVRIKQIEGIYITNQVVNDKAKDAIKGLKFTAVRLKAAEIKG